VRGGSQAHEGGPRRCAPVPQLVRCSPRSPRVATLWPVRRPANPRSHQHMVARVCTNVFKASLWRRLIGKALQAGRLGGRLASDWYGVRLTTMASGSRRFGVRFVEIEQGGRCLRE